jgi:hypothetical protein
MGMSRQTQGNIACRGDGPPADVWDWRRCRLAEAGFPDVLADRLARSRVDLHRLLDLVDRGCPPELAVRILAPLGREWDWLGDWEAR